MLSHLAVTALALARVNTRMMDHVTNSNTRLALYTSGPRSSAGSAKSANDETVPIA